jgi:uncharacterized membrane protein
MEQLGPIQLMVVGFEDGNFTGEILPELERLAAADVVRVVDLMFVDKDDQGEITAVQLSDLTTEEAMQFGAFAGALVGFGVGGEEGAETGALAGVEAGEDGHIFDEDEVWYLADAIPNGSSAAIALIEHRWAIPLRSKIQAAGGVALADEWVHPEDLVAIGLVAEANAELDA